MVKKKTDNAKKQRPKKKSPSVQLDGNLKDSNVIIGNENVIDKSINTTNIFNNIKPKTFIFYGIFVAFLIGLISWGFYYNFFRYDRAIASGELNVLIIPFVEEKSWGYMNTDLGWSVAQILTDGVRREFEDSGLEADIKVIGPADKVPKSYAFTETQLIQSVETISEELNGQIIIYGIISQDEYGDSIVSTKIYISPTNFGEAQELISDSIVGELSLGSFRLTGNTANGSDLLAQNKELRDRLMIFSSIINFLGAYLGEDFEKAKEYIKNAEEPTLWSNPKGLEVIYLMNGNMNIRHARVFIVSQDLQATLQTIELAKVNFEESMNISIQNGNGEYSRAYLGLAGAESLLGIAEATIYANASLINTDALQQSLIYLDDAQAAENKPETAEITVKVKYGKAQIALAYYAKTANVEYLSEAKSYYQQVVDEYELTDNQRIAELAALSHSGLGHIAVQNNEIEAVIRHFLSAQELTTSPVLKVQCIVNIGDIYFATQEYNLALKYYQDAFQRKSELEKAVSTERINEIEKRINFIKDGEPL